jgi:hypothetical protein
MSAPLLRRHFIALSITDGAAPIGMDTPKVSDH